MTDIVVGPGFTADNTLNILRQMYLSDPDNPKWGAGYGERLGLPPQTSIKNLRPPGLFIAEKWEDVNRGVVLYRGVISEYKKFSMDGKMAVPAYAQDRLFIGSMQAYAPENMGILDELELQYLTFAANLGVPPFSLILLGCSSIILLASLIFF